MRAPSRFAGRRAAALLFLLATSVGALVAQAIVDPTVAEFDPSSDHLATASDGRPLVSSYSLAFYSVGASTPFTTVNLGKPSPDPDGKIRVAFRPLLTTTPAGGVPYEARVTAVGPGGTSGSAISNTFSFSTICSPSLTLVGQTLPASGGSGSASVTAGSGCTWLATSSAGWLTITGGASGVGAGTVTFSAGSNPGSSPRTAAITVAGQTFTVTQAAACTYGAAPAAHSLAAAGGSASTSIATSQGCSWTATTSATWVSLMAATGSGPGTVTFTVAPNSSPSSRTATITAGGASVTLTQAGAACSYSLAPATHSLAAGGGSASASMTASPGCSWTATTSATWISLAGGVGGAGSGTIPFTAAPNATSSSRTGTIVAGGQTLTVTQAGAACSYALSQAGVTVTSSGGTGSFSIATTAGCTWSTASNAAWLTITDNASGSGSKAVAFRAAANTTASARLGTITVAGRTFTVTQPPAALPAPSGLRILGGGGD